MSGKYKQNFQNVLKFYILISEKYRPRYQYKAIPRADFPGSHDYECDHSISLVNCQSLTFNEIEAMRQCDVDVECQAFVISYDKTWIGKVFINFTARQILHYEILVL